MAWTREQMAARAAKALRDGFYVKLGIGIPTLVSNYMPPGISVQLPSEGVVELVIPDRGVVTIDKKGGSGMALIELAPGVSFDEIRAKTEASFRLQPRQ